MLARCRRRRHRGLTLVEVLVALTVAGVVLGLIMAISVREQRVFADLAERAAIAGQLREAAALLPIDLRAAAPLEGDIRQARDTVVELRATIGSAVVCDTTTGGVILSPAVAGADTYASFLMPVEAGDTVWLFMPGDTLDRWLPHAVARTGTAPPGQCAAGGPRLSPAAAASVRVTLALGDTLSSPSVGIPLRVTRPMRYSVYRASDGGWYVGERDWNNASRRFNTIQPVAGPVLPPSSGAAAFSYRDSAGNSIASPVTNPAAIRLIEIALRAQTKHAIRVLGAGPLHESRIDSALVAVSIHNR